MIHSSNPTPVEATPAEVARALAEDDDIEMERERVETSAPVVVDQPRVPAAEGTKALSFEQIVAQNADGLTNPEVASQLTEDGKNFLKERRKFGQIGAFLKRCAANVEDPFCVAYRYYKSTPPSDRARSSRKTRVHVKAVSKYLKTKDFDSLKGVGFSSILPAAKKLKIEELKDISKAAATNEMCLTEDIYVALGSTLEYDFPDDENVNLNNQLLERSQKCFNTEFTGRSTFRLGMFKVWKNHCDEAVPLFESALSNQTMRALHPRSTYWREWCKNKKGNEPVPPDQFYKNFPDSFHALLADDGPTPMAYNLLTTNVDPQVRFRSTTNKEFNAYLDVLDTFVRLGEKQIAFGMVENLKSEKYIKEDPEVLLYLAILCNRVQAGLVKFQIMGRMFDKNPAFKTIKTMKLYYPAWYMDTVVQYKEKVNPYLIMALIRQESAFNTRAHSPADARGLMQLLPGTARGFGRVKKNELFTPEKNISSGVKFFAHLMERYNNQVPLALAAYNAGPLNVDEWVKRYPTDNPLLFIDIIPFRETRDYVGSILRNWYWYNKLYAESYPTQSSKNDPLMRAISSAP